jgi:signal transduction histidine kinase
MTDTTARLGPVAAARTALGSVSRQFGAGVALVVAPVLVTLIVFGWLMVISGDQALVIAGVVAAAGALAGVGGWLFGRQLLSDLDAIRAGLDAVGAGAREVTITTAADDELRALAGSANAMIEQLSSEEAARDQADAARRGLVAAVSHDLRTPITSLRLLAEAVGDDIVPGEQRRVYLDRMGTHIHALSALIDDLFELSRLEAGDINWSLQRISLEDLVGETVEAMRADAEAKGIRVTAQLAPSLAPARGNPEKVQRVLFNLIQNAIRHTPADGSVVVHAEPANGTVEIEVADDGVGIPGEDRVHVFSAFYRGGADAARAGAGAGLGLAVSRAIVEAHGGRIWLEHSTVGTRVRFSLPLAG